MQVPRDRQVKEQFICGIKDEYMQRKIDSELKVISKTDEITSDKVLMWARQEEALRTQVLVAGQTKMRCKKEAHADIVDAYTYPKGV